MKKPHWQKRLELWAGHQLLVGFLRWTQSASFEQLDRAGTRLGSLAYYLTKRYRDIAERNLALCFPEKSPEEIRKIARETFCNFTRTLLEALKMVHMKDEKVCQRISIDGLSHIDDGLTLQKGIILVTAHFGNWEMLARRLVIYGYKMNVVAREADYGATTELMTRLREASGYQVIMRDRVAREGLRCLKRNECLAILPDQNQTTGRLFVNFFGRPASTAEGPALLAMRTGATVLPLFCYRLPENSYRGVICPPVELSDLGDARADIAENMARITRIIEEQVRRYPSHWLWLHDRWATQPTSNGENKL